jgi:hypothetical protein
MSAPERGSLGKSEFWVSEAWGTFSSERVFRRQE